MLESATGDILTMLAIAGSALLGAVTKWLHGRAAVKEGKLQATLAESDMHAEFPQLRANVAELMADKAAEATEQARVRREVEKHEFAAQQVAEARAAWELEDSSAGMVDQ